jgi:hypothetical protein
VLVSKESARVEHDVTVVPEQQVATCVSQDAAVDRARGLASERRVDAWLTADHIHFVRIASHRPGSGEEGRKR